MMDLLYTVYNLISPLLYSITPGRRAEKPEPVEEHEELVQYPGYGYGCYL